MDDEVSEETQAALSALRAVQARKSGKARKFSNEGTTAALGKAVQKYAADLAKSGKGSDEPQYKPLPFTIARATALASFATDADHVNIKRTLELLDQQEARINGLESMINRLSQQYGAQAKEVAALTRKVSK